MVAIAGFEEPTLTPALVTAIDGFYAYIIDFDGHVINRVDLVFEKQGCRGTRQGTR
ncbi:hypothetical protein JQ634_07180 [Bradyrhizobium sp. AUGA SZCCT0240]|uniref:hypothetical protein n=1 Tax=unclassified Bradyrhizobium TaxID=2631580 RepID=UPI001BAD44BC|nr:MULTISPECIES: hypothetical protein [unclassified Bradyrhizobium]MBR1192118.1 hypothetical protein [Bradyrhizobium sp. AUGA SZCCT0160]MBR1194490.1 hypothetical protein [Bradyrhizobium sp. AUGA SZCCT0158]MBR1241283.1 hypothetical protein [Bradyrhizobium sp. AUGA SZCCT0274]MBR1253480.1 hypothetical protein [Bradyrhizobium sp. AUGA SZCCT0240]